MEGRRQEKVDAGREKFAAYQKRKKKSVRQRDRVQEKEDEAGGETLLSDTSTGALDMSLCSSSSSVSGPCETGSDVVRELNAKVRELEDVISGQRAALEALRRSSREQQAEHKAQLDSYVARLREYEGAVQERNSVIERLTASLHSELTTRCALQQQGDHLAQEVSLLERQLQATSELVEGHQWDTGVRPDQYLALQNKVLTLEASLQSVEELKARLAAAEAERDDTAHELRQHKSRSAQEVQRLMGEVEQVQQRAAAAAAEHVRKLAETEEGFGLQLRLKEEHRRRVEEEKRLLQVAHEERSALENGGLEVASRQLDDALRANADTRAAMAEARRRYEEELAAVRKQSDEEVRALRRDVDELRQQLERAVSESRRLSGELEREREAHAWDVAALSAQLREHGQACQLQEESHKQVVQALNERLKEAAQGEEKTPDVVTAHLESFQADRRRYEEHVDALNARLQESMKTGEARERLLADKEAELVVLKAQVSKVSSLLELATQSENALVQQVGSLSARLQEANKNKADAESYKLLNDELNSKIKKLNDILSSREQKIKEYEDEVTELKSRLEELEVLKVQAENYEAKIKNLSSETKELLKYKDKALALQSEIDILKGNLNELLRMFPDAEALVPSEHHVSKRETMESFFTVDKFEQLRVKLGDVLKQREEDRCLHQAEVARLNKQTAANAQVAERQAAEWEEKIAFYRDRLESLSGQVCAVEEQQRTEVSRLQDAHRTEVECLKSSLDQEVAALKAELAAQKAHHDKELGQHQAAFNVELSRLKEAHDLKLVELDETYKSQSAVQVQDLGSPEEKTEEEPGEVEAKRGELSGPDWSELELCRQQIAVLKGRLEEASAAQQEHIATVAACQLQVESYKQQVELLDGRCVDELAARQTELDELRGKIQSMTDGEKGLREQIMTAEAQIRDLQESRESTVAEVTKQLEQLKGQLGVRDEELASLRSQLQEKTDREKGLREQIMTAEAQIRDLQESRDSTVVEVTKQLEQLKGQLGVRDEEMASLRSQLQEKTDCEKGLREQIMTAEAQIRDLQESRDSTVVEVTKQLEQLKGQLGVRDEELASLRSQLQEKTDCEKGLREQIMTAEAQIRDLQESRESTVVEVTKQLEQLKGQLGVRDEELASLRSQLQEKTDCEKGLREQIMTAEAQIRDLQESRDSTVAEVTKQLEQLKGQLGVRDEEMASLRSQLQEKTNCEKSLREQIMTAEAQIRDLQESRDSTVAEVTKQLEQLKRQLGVRDEEMASLRSQLQEKTNCEKSLREQIMTAEAQIRDLQESRDSTVAEVTKQLEQLKGQLGVRDEEMASLRSQLQEKTDCEKGLREQIMTAEAQIRDLQESRESTVVEVTKQLEQLKGQLGVRDEEMASLRSQLQEKTNCEKSLREQIMTAEAQIRDLQESRDSTVAEVTKQLEQLKRQLGVRDEELASLRSQLQEKTDCEKGLREQIMTAEAQIRDLQESRESTVVELTKQLEQLKGQLGVRDEELASLRSQLQEKIDCEKGLREQIMTAEAQIRDLQESRESTVVEVTKQLEQLKGQLGVRDEEMASLRSQLQEKTDCEKGLREQIMTAEAQIRDLQESRESTVVEVTKQLEQLKGQLGVRDEDLASLRSQLQEKTDCEKGLREQIMTAEAQIRDLQESRERAVAEVTKQLEQLKGQLGVRDEELASLRSQLQEKTDCEKGLREQIMTAEAQIRDLQESRESTVVELTKQLEQLKGQLGVRDEELASLRSQLQEKIDCEKGLREQIMTAEAQIRDLQESRESTVVEVTKQLEQLKGQLGVRDEEMASLRSQLQEKTDCEKGLREQIMTAEAQIRDLQESRESTVVEVTKQLEQLKGQLGVRDEDLASLRSQLQEKTDCEKGLREQIMTAEAQIRDLQESRESTVVEVTKQLEQLKGQLAVREEELASLRSDDGTKGVNEGKTRGGRLTADLARQQADKTALGEVVVKGEPRGDVADLQEATVQCLKMGGLLAGKDELHLALAERVAQLEHDLEKSSRDNSQLTLKVVKAKELLKRLKDEKNKASARSADLEAECERLRGEGVELGAQLEAAKSERVREVKELLARLDARKGETEETPVSSRGEVDALVAKLSVQTKEAGLLRERLRLAERRCEAALAARDEYEREVQETWQVRKDAEDELLEPREDPGVARLEMERLSAEEAARTPGEEEERLPSWDDVLSDYQREVLGQLAVRCEQHAGLGDLLGSSGILQETMYQQKQQLLQRLQGAEHGPSVAAASGCEDILTAVEETLHRQHVAALQAVARAWRDRYESELAAVVLALEETWAREETARSSRKFDAAANCQIKVETLLTAQERLLSALEDVQEQLRGFHHGAVARLREEMRAEHGHVLQQLQQMRAAVSSLRSPEDSREGVLGADAGQLRREQEQRHTREMEELRRYFEQKCADVEKRYAEEVFSQHGRKLSASSAGSGEEPAVGLWLVGGDRGRSVPALTHICDSYSVEPGYKDLEERCRADYERRLLESRDHLESKHCSELAALHDHYQQLLLQHQPQRMSAEPVELEGASGQQPGNKPGAEEHFVESVIDKLACITVDAALSKVCAEARPRGEERRAETADASSQVPHAAEGTPEARQRTDSGQGDSFASLLGSLRRASGSAVTGCLDRLEAAHEEELRAARSAVQEQAGMLEVEHVACQQRLHEQVEQARCDVVATLHHHLQALLSESGPIPQELAALQERFAGPLQREVDRLKQELAAVNAPQQKDQLTFSCPQSSLVEHDFSGSLEGLVRERDELQQALGVLRCVVRELLDYCARCEDELNGTLVEELSPTDRVHLSPDTTALASLVRDRSLPSDSSHVSVSLRGELDRCLARLHTEASSVLALSRGLTRGKELVGEGLCELATPRRPPPNDPAHSLLYARRSMSEPSSPPSKQLDEAQQERDRLLEEARRDKEDLRLQVRVDPSLGASCKPQVEAADKQLRATRLFLEEQAAEREQEREEAVREVAVLRAQLRDRERDRAEHQRLLKEVDGLDLQLKESATQLAQSEADRVRLQANLDSASEKISTLREIIVELEVAVENRSANEKNLKQRLADLECLLHQQDESHRQLAGELESLREEAGPAHLAAHISALEEQLCRHRLHVEQFQSGSGAVRRMKSQIQELEAAVGRKTRELESLHCVVRCDASPAGSPLSEDVSIREQLDVMRCCSPDRGLRETPSPVPLPVEDFQRLQEKVERLCRAEEAALKRIADLEMELRGVRRREEEVSAERDVLLLQTEEQLLRISALQARLDDQRRAVDSARWQAVGELRAELQDRTDEMHSLRDACDASRKEVEEVRGLLDQARRQAAVQEAEVMSLAERLASRDGPGDRPHSSHAQDLGVTEALLLDARGELRAVRGDVSRLGAERAQLRVLLDCHRSLDLSARQQARLSALLQRAAETEPGDPQHTHFSEEVFREAAETSLSCSLLPSQEQTAVSHPDVPDHTMERDQPSKELDDARTALESVQRQNAELSRQVEDLLACRAALEDSKAENLSLAERVEALGAECSAVRQDKLLLEQRVECLTAQCSRVDGLQRERCSLLEEVEALKKRCSAEDTLQQEKVALAARCNELQTTCGALEALNASLTAEQALLKQECSTLKKIQDENYKLSQQVEIFQTECSTLRTVQQEKVSLTEKVNDLESKCLQLEGVREENISQAQKIVELQTLCSFANSLRDENAALSQINVEQQRENSRLLQKIKNLGERSSVAESVQRKNSSLVGRVRELEVRCSAVGSLQEERDALSRRVRVLEGECEVAKDAQRGRIEALENALLEKTALAAEMEARCARFADVLKENAALSQRVQELEAQCALLQGSRQDDGRQALSSAHLELEQIIVKLQEENRVLRDAYVKDLQESEEKQGSLDELSKQLQRELDESEKLDSSLLGTLSPSDTDPPAGGVLEPPHDALLRKVLAAGFSVLTLSELSVVHQLVCAASAAAGHGLPCDTDTGSTAAQLASLRSALDGERARAVQLAGHVRLQAQMLADVQVQQASVQGSIARYIELLETERGRTLCLEGKLASERASARQLTAALEGERQKMRSMRIQDCSLLESMRRQLDVALENEEQLQRRLQLACSENKAALQGTRERGQQSPGAEAVVSAGSDSDGDAELRERVLALKERLQEMSSAQHIDTLEERLAPLRQREQQLLEELGDARRQARELRTALVVREQRLAVARDQLTALGQELSASRSREAELERRLTPEGLEASQSIKGGAASAGKGGDCRDVEWLQEQIKVLREKEKVNRAAWLQQKAALEDALEAREHQRVTGDRLLQSGCDIEERMTHLFGKYLRVESYRKSLVWQKRYLLVALSGYQDHEAATLGQLAVLAGHTPVRPRPTPRTRFRVAVVAVTAIQRMRYLVRRWRHGRRVGRSAIVGRPCCECVAPETHPSCRLPPSRDEGAAWHSSGPHRPWRLGEDGRVTLLEPGTGAQFAARSDHIQRRLGLATAST